MKKKSLLFGRGEIWGHVQFSSIQSLSHVQLFVTLWTSARQASLSCCSPWGCKESDTTEQLNWTDSVFRRPADHVAWCCLKTGLNSRKGWLFLVPIECSWGPSEERQGILLQWQRSIWPEASTSVALHDLSISVLCSLNLPSVGWGGPDS